MKLLRVIFSVLFVVMVLMVTWGFVKGDWNNATASIADEPWLIVTTIDLYIAFLGFYIWVFYKETSMVAKIL